MNMNAHQVLEFYDQNHLHAPPRDVLLETSFALAGNQSGVTNFQDEANQFFDGGAVIRTTKCASLDFIERGIVTGPTTAIPCSHKGYKPASECYRARVGRRNPYKYVVATAHHADAFLEVPGTPVLTFQDGAMVLLQPSDTQILYVNTTDGQQRMDERDESKRTLKNQAKSAKKWGKKNV